MKTPTMIHGLEIGKIYDTDLGRVKLLGQERYKTGRDKGEWSGIYVCRLLDTDKKGLYRLNLIYLMKSDLIPDE